MQTFPPTTFNTGIRSRISMRPSGAGGSGPVGSGGGDGDVIPIRSEKAPPDTRVIAVTSGKGGVGKSVISANLGLCLAAQGRKVLLVDADLALANLDLMLGLKAPRSIKQLLTNELRVEDVLVKGPKGIALLPACSGEYDMTELEQTTRMTLFNAIDSLESQYDTVVIDTGAGIGSNSTSFAAAAQQTLVVMTPDPASLMDSYAMIKVLSSRCGVNRVYLVVNMAKNPREAEQVVNRLMGLVHQFLDVSVIPVGYLYRDDSVIRSVQGCRPLVTTYPQSPAAVAIQGLCSRLLLEDPSESSWGGPRVFWKRIMGISDSES